MDARKHSYGAADLAELFAGSRKVITARGKKSAAYDPSDPEDLAGLEKAATGPTGNLRAPAVRCGKTWLVGWGEEAWSELFG